MTRFLISIFVFSGLSGLKAQIPAKMPPKVFKTNRKGQFYGAWGWNRDAYTNSTLHLRGDDYDITLHKMKAHDKPSEVSYHNYLEPDRITIPQTNLRLGYFVKDNLAITFGVDHMKYVMTQDQTIDVTGSITRTSHYKGELSGPMVISEDFLTFEHTDGLNLVNFGVEKYANFHQSKDNRFSIDGLAGGELGVMIPKTNAKLLDYKRNDEFHVSGFGASLKAGIGFTFFKHLVLKSELKGGYINMWDIILHEKGVNGKGSQDFLFVQGNVLLGFIFKI